jgi:hypothetical protein
MTLVHNAYSDWLRVANKESTEEWAKTHHLNPPKLFISNLGKCPRAAFFHSVQHLPSHPFHAEETHPFSKYVLSLMQQGLIDEADTERALRHMYDGNLRTQLNVGDDVWLGTIDFFVEPDTIIEHKATNATNFVRKCRLPYDFHCLQVLAYRHFVQLERPDRMIYARLYYRTHAHWAEFEVYDCGGFISWNGNVDGKRREGAFEVSLAEEMEKTEGFWRAGELPPRYDDPLEVPFTCARSTKQGVFPSCRYFSHCWPELPAESSTSA